MCHVRLSVKEILERYDQGQRQFEKIDISYPNDKLNKASIPEICFINSKLCGVSFCVADLRDSVFIECDLSNSDMTNVQLINAQLKDCILNNTVLQAAILSGSAIHNSDMTDASLYGADVRGCSFESSNLTNVNLGYTKFDTDTSFAKATLLKIRMREDPNYRTVYYPKGTSEAEIISLWHEKLTQRTLKRLYEQDKNSSVMPIRHEKMSWDINVKDAIMDLDAATKFTNIGISINEINLHSLMAVKKSISR